MVPAAFFAELDKVAVSVGRTLAVVQRRVAQGAKVSPGIMHDMAQQAAAGIKTTARGDRRIALNAADDVAQHHKMLRANNNAVTVAAKERLVAGAAAARGGRPGIYDPRRPTASHYDFGPNPDAGMGYTKQHMDAMAGSSAIVNPQKLTKAVDPRIARGLARTSSGNTAVTAVSPVPQMIVDRNRMGVAPTLRPPAVAA